MEPYEAGKLKNALVADKIIGKAASVILILGGAKEVYGDTISKTALAYLTAHGIKALENRVIDVISNREGNGICPMERAVMDVEAPEVGLQKLRETIAALRAQAKPQAV